MALTVETERPTDLLSYLTYRKEPWYKKANSSSQGSCNFCKYEYHTVLLAAELLALQ